GALALRPLAAMGRSTSRTSDRTARERSPSGPPHLHLSGTCLMTSARRESPPAQLDGRLRSAPRDQDANQRRRRLQFAADHPLARNLLHRLLLHLLLVAPDALLLQLSRLVAIGLRLTD